MDCIFRRKHSATKSYSISLVWILAGGLSQSGEQCSWVSFCTGGGRWETSEKITGQGEWVVGVVAGWKTTCLHPLPPPPNFVTSPQSPICHQYKMAPVPLFAASTETTRYAGYQGFCQCLPWSNSVDNPVLFSLDFHIATHVKAQDGFWCHHTVVGCPCAMTSLML